MDRIREARRGSMAAVNGSLSRRRQRSSSLRDSPEEDGAMEMQETSRLRDRGGKKDRDRDRSGRNKRRRGDRMLHGSHREEGEDSSEESVDDDDEDEEEDSSVAVRLQPPPAHNPAPAASGMQSLNIRKGYPVKSVRPPGTCTWKVVEEMIGAPIPRKARSSSVKRSQECWVSGGAGGCGGGEQVSYQASISPARRSPSSTAPVSPSSSNVSIRKKMKPITVPKPRPPKTSKSSSIQEIEIEVAEVLFGMTRQVPSKQDDLRHDPKESNGSGNEVKSRVSSPNPISPPATSQTSTVRPSNPCSNPFPLTATAPKRKRPRMRIEDESPTSPPSSTVLPALSSSSAAKFDTEMVPPPVVTKAESASPRSEKHASPAVENGGVLSDQAVSNISSAIVFAKVQQDSVKAESIPDPKETDNRTEKKAKGEAFSPPKESPAANLDVNIEDAPANKAAMISDTQREEKFSIDLMALPGKSSPEIEINSDCVAECKSLEMENAPKPEVFKAEGEKIEKKSKSEPEETAQDDKNGGKPSTDDSDSRKQVGKEKNLDLQLDLDKLDKDVTGASKHQVLKQQSKAPRAEPKTEKAGPTASLPMPMQITGWPGGFPPFGYMGQVPPLPSVVPVDGSSSSSKQSLLPSQPRPKRCAAHCYIAQNIHYHQQITRLNPFWPSAAGAAPLYASKQYNLNSAPPSDSAILGSPMQGSLPGRSLGSVQEKGLPASAAHSVLSAKDKSNAASQFMDASQRKPPTLQQSSQTGSAGNMLAPAFIFPLNQQQAAAAGAAAVGAAVANRSGIAKLSPGSGNTAQSSSSTGYAAMGASGANGSGTNMSFNYPGLPPNEAQYLAFLQNNAYSFPIPAHVGGAQPYRGASPAQAMPFFNLSFYPSQMLHPSQLRLQQQPPSSQQPPYSQQGHQNPSTSSGSSSSQKNTQQSQRVPAAAASAITAGNSHGFPSSKQQHPSHSHQVRQSEPETGGEDAPSTADSRVSQAHKSIYTQKFAMPAHSQNFALIAPAAALSSGVGNHSEKQQQQQQQQQSQSQVMKVDLTPSQAFAMSFASFGGAAASAASAAAGGAAPHGLDFSSMAQNHAIFQSLPETVRHGYQVSAAAAAAAAAAHSTQQQQNKKSEDGKSVTDLGNTSTVGEEGKISSASKVLGNAQQHSLTFSRADTESPISSILTNSVIDSSSRTLNLIQPPPSGAPRVSSRPASAAPASNSVTNSSNSQHLLSQQHQQQVLQLPKQVQQLQLQQQLQQQQRAKSASSHSNNASLYNDRLPGNSTPSKFPQGIVGFPPTLIQSSASSQPAQWKTSTRAANPASASAALAVASSSASSSSVKNQIPLQQQVRSQQPPSHQTHQISFGVSPSKVAGQLGQHLAAAGNNAAASLSSAATITVGSPQNSVSKSSSGSPHSSAIAKSVPPPSPVLPFQKQQSGKNSSSSSTISPLPATNRNTPSILGSPHITTPQNLGSKPQPSSQHLQQTQMPKQHSPQAQLFFSYPYMQSQASQSDAAAAAAGYFQQHHRRPPDQQRQNSTPASTGMLSLGPSSSLSLAAAPDPSKGSGAGAAATSNSKNLMPASLLQHPAQFATISSQPGSGANAGHPMMYIHAMQSVPLKPDASAAAEQKPAAGR